MTHRLYEKRTNVRSHASLHGWLVFIFLESLVLIQAGLSYRDHFLTLGEMRSIKVLGGLPFLWHFGMWGDLLIISPLVGILVTRHFDQWRPRSVVFAIIIGLIITSAMGWIYSLSVIPEAHMQNHHLTSAGIIHLFYMFVAIAILFEYFIFTPSLSTLELRIVSTLVLLHVFLGTHMALGILKFFIKLDWYPGEPLKSSIGYATILTVTALLILRNLDIARVTANLRTVAIRMARFFMYWIEDDIYWSSNEVETPHGLLKFLDAIGGRVLEPGFFLWAAWSILSRNEGIGSLLPGVLVLTLAIKFVLSRRSAKVELSIGERSFPAGQLPESWSGPREPAMIIVSVFFFFVLYMALVWLAFKVIVVSMLLFIIGCIDWNTRRLIHKNIKRLFSDENYEPTIEDKDFEVIKARRKVVREYLFQHRHLWKEGLCAVGCGVALCVAIASKVYRSEWLEFSAYAFLIFTLWTNEIVTWRWRAVRNLSLITIENQLKSKE